MGRKRSTQGLCRFKVSRNTEPKPKPKLLTAINRKRNILKTQQKPKFLDFSKPNRPETEVKEEYFENRTETEI